MTQQAAPFLARLFAAERRAWRGEMALWRVFWGYGVLASSALIALFASAISLGQRALQQGLILVFAGYTVWILVAIWRCAPNALPYWGNLARWLTMAWALNAAFVLAFLQLDLVIGNVW